MHIIWFVLVHEFGQTRSLIDRDSKNPVHDGILGIHIYSKPCKGIRKSYGLPWLPEDGFLSRPQESKDPNDIFNTSRAHDVVTSIVNTVPWFVLF